MDFGKVFVSSILNPAVEDPFAERDIVKQVVDSYGFLKAWAFEKEPASTEQLDESYLQRVEECDLFILIVGGKITDPVAREYERAKELHKPVLIFAKEVSNRSPQVRWLLEAAPSKYAKYENAEALAETLKAAIEQTLVRGLQTLKERTSLKSIIVRLRELAERKAKVHVRPIIPANAGRYGFHIQEATPASTVLNKVSSGHRVHLPTTRVVDILLGAPDDPPVLILEGRLQWITSNEAWKFFEEKPEAGSLFGFAKVSNLQDPSAVALIDRFRKQGYRFHWDREENLSGRFADGWEIVYDEDGRYFRITDRPSDLILIRKHD